MNQVLRTVNLGQSFNGNTVLSNISLSLDQGERLAVIGSSGSGKTTLLRLIAGLEAPSAGEISIAGKQVSIAGEVLIAPEHREVAMVFQGLALFPHLRALEQIAFAARGRGGRVEAKALLEQIGLGHRGSARLDELSGGERQRIALARAIAQRPRLILMDEPFSSLDDERRGEMRDLLRSLLDTTGTTLILVTHSRDDALDLAHRTLVLDRGQPVAKATLESILIRPLHIAAVRAFGLGQVIDGELQSNGTVETIFGSVSTDGLGSSGPVRVLVRPAQARIVPDGAGVEAQVVRIELSPPEAAEVRRIALIRRGQSLLRVFVRNQAISVGDQIDIIIEGSCDLVVG